MTNKNDVSAQDLEPTHNDEEMGDGEHQEDIDLTVTEEVLVEDARATYPRRWYLKRFAGLAIAAAIMSSVIGTRHKWQDDDDKDDAPSTNATMQTVRGKIVDIHTNQIFPGTVMMKDNRIESIRSDDSVKEEQYILPGFVDSHVHIESSLLVPSEFARLAVRHGTVAAVSDPHEIANVLGRKGIQFMLDNAEQVPFYFFFGAPCCVPATSFETAGAELGVTDIEELFQDDRIKYLSEMMNWPGVLLNDPIVLGKIQAAVDAGRPVDGHAPGLTGADAKTYIDHGITTDHECYSLQEAVDKLKYGMKVQIRQGSAARNFDALSPIIGTDPESVMFCTDDAHPDYLLQRDVDYHVRRSIELGYDTFDVLRIASKNPVEHYGLPVGLLREGDPADFIIVDNLIDFNALEVWINGTKVAAHGDVLFDGVSVTPINNFGARPIRVADIARSHASRVRVIQVRDGDLITTAGIHNVSDTDVLKLVVVNRYEEDVPPAVGYVQGFGIHTGAIASSVAHDSHNIIALGRTDEDIVKAVNTVIAMKGGLAVAAGNGKQSGVLPLPIAGLMSDGDGFEVAEQYSALDKLAKEYGSPLQAPFMTLSFMALLVVPELKLSDMGLFDGTNFEFVEVDVV